MPMHFIVVDLAGKFKLSPQGYRYALTVIDRLTYYAWSIMLFTKEAYGVVHAYLVHSKFSGSHKMLSHSGTEFKNKLFMHIVSTMEMKQVFRSPYYPQDDGCIKNVYKWFI